MQPVDITLITDSRYVNPSEINWYIQNILDDDKLVTEALQKRGLSVTRINWDNPTFDWTKTRYAVFRTPWDYFDRFAEFAPWLKKVSTQTHFINPIETIWWNIDKHYLRDLNTLGINIPPTVFIEQGDTRSLTEIIKLSGWSNSILKPAVSGSARHTYKLNKSNIETHEAIFQQLIKEESMLLQEFQHQITTKGEVALMVFGGKFSHAVLKKAKQGDFRVQDDFGGSVHEYIPSEKEIKFAEETVTQHFPFVWICLRRKHFKEVKLRWRASGGPRRSLGWVPFKTGALKYGHGQVRFSTAGGCPVGTVTVFPDTTCGPATSVKMRAGACTCAVRRPESACSAS